MILLKIMMMMIINLKIKKLLISSINIKINKSKIIPKLMIVIKMIHKKRVKIRKNKVEKKRSKVLIG
jgi:hypothetical protein